MTNLEQSAPATILLVDDHPANLGAFFNYFDELGFTVKIAQSGAGAFELITRNRPDIILLDIIMPRIDGFEVCRRLKAHDETRDIPVIFMTALTETIDKVKGFDAGGVDYITKPFQPEEVLARVAAHLNIRNLQKNLSENNRRLQQEIAKRKRAQEALQKAHDELEARVEERTIELQNSYSEIQRLKDQLQAENIYLREEIKLEHNIDNIIGQNERLKNVLFQVEQVASTDTTVLILGETGTGKELIAHAIHNASPRKGRPLVKVSCATLPAHLIENELFGHEKGAFTGAHIKQMGRFELANGTTIFLDEIGELPVELQTKLLRVIQDGEFERLGNPRRIRVDVRVIAATNRDLEAEMRAGRFRQDLYYRLSVYPLALPSLRERSDDIPSLVQSLVQKFSKKLGKRIEIIPQTTMHALQHYAWPGNVRELENVIERAVITTQEKTLRVTLPKILPLAVDTNKTLEEIERDYILQILEKTHWKINGEHGAALILDLHPNTLRFRMRKLGLKRPS